MNVETEIIVRVRHIREANLCMRGARQWFAHHKLDFDKFLREGLPISELERCGDALSELVCMTARDEQAREH